MWQSSPMGPFDAWPSKGGGFEHFYGFIGGENNQWDPALYEGTTPIEPPATAEEGYHLTDDLTDHCVNWIRQQKALMPDKPFFIYFAPGATHAPHHVAPEWIEKYKGKFSHGWDAQREQTFARQKELGVIPADAELTPRNDLDHRVGRHARRAQAGARAGDGGVRRLPRAHRPQRRADRRHPGGPRGPRRHDHLLHHRRQRRVGRGHHERRLQRDGQLQRHARARDARVHDQQARRVRLAQLLQPLLGRLGVGDEHPVPVDEAGGLPLGRHPQRHDRALAQRDHGAGRCSLAVHPRHRRRPHGPRGGRPPAAHDRQRRAAGPDRGHEHAVHLQRRGGAGAPRPPVLRDVRQPRHLPPGVERRHEAQDAVDHGRSTRCRPSTTTCGSSTTAPPATTASPATWPRSNPSGWPSCSGSGSSRRPSTTCSPSTTAPPSASTRTWPDDRR